MAEKKTKEPEDIIEETPIDPKKYWAEKVPFRAFRDSGRYKDDIVAVWNGRSYVIKRGYEVMIPRAVREIIYQSMEQDERTADMIDRETAAFAAESARYN